MSKVISVPSWSFHLVAHDCNGKGHNTVNPISWYHIGPFLSFKTIFISNDSVSPSVTKHKQGPLSFYCRYTHFSFRCSLMGAPASLMPVQAKTAVFVLRLSVLFPSIYTVVLLNLQFDMRQFVLQVLTPLPFLQIRWVLIQVHGNRS